MFAWLKYLIEFNYDTLKLKKNYELLGVCYELNQSNINLNFQTNKQIKLSICKQHPVVLAPIQHIPDRLIVCH
ncbi:hypothetical protein BpHYR1_018587 [Brachionus plicatilis]|uniref:Uncharacterized protein n=1 Tax=Brachionus plicatilis TaxID=10195 RepID=A0A3M7P4B4_BRAPC|nr:hypothetical protein BpHYR1_018587 [Brachionus plicatilis]